MSSPVTVKELLEAGAHFGHQTQHWNPKMKDYIFGARNGIYIIDLSTTQKLIQEACQFVTQCAAEGGSILFVGTKKQAQEVVKEEAIKCGMHYITYRWLGGVLTNFSTIKIGMQRLNELEDMKQKGIFEALPKKEAAGLEKEKNKLIRVFDGIRNMQTLPSVLFVVDPKKEDIAVKEANKLQIPVVAVVDTNTDPDGVDYIIPGNDDAIKAIRLYTGAVAEAALEGRKQFEERVRAQEKTQEGETRSEIKAAQENTRPSKVKVERVEKFITKQIVSDEELEEPEKEKEPEDIPS